MGQCTHLNQSLEYTEGNLINTDTYEDIFGHCNALFIVLFHANNRHFSDWLHSLTAGGKTGVNLNRIL